VNWRNYSRGWPGNRVSANPQRPIKH
jgi:hypothetical protein